MFRRVRLFSALEEENTPAETTENAAEEETAQEEAGEETSPLPQEVSQWLTSRQALPYNPHFPNTNQTKHCWSSYVNYHQCMKLKGEGNTECAEFKNAAMMLCPTIWIQQWDEQREEGVFASPYEN